MKSYTEEEVEDFAENFMLDRIDSFAYLDLVEMATVEFW